MSQFAVQPAPAVMPDELLYAVDGAIATITLNRPEALNGWTGRMAAEVRHAVARAETDRAVVGILITGAGRAFSAGGDIRALYDLGRAGRHAEMLPFWSEEYALNTIIKHYPKPYVALIDGIVMGGPMMGFRVPTTDAPVMKAVLPWKFCMSEVPSRRLIWVKIGQTRR